MSEVKWIKITTSMFEDEKIDYIESLPEADAILVIWIKLITQAGKCNANGFIFLTEQIPYTEEMLAHKFRRPLNVVRLALQALKNLQMIEMDDKGYLKIVNWEKHQNIDGLDKIREQTRKRVAKYREKQLELPPSNVTGNVTVTGGNGTDIDKELDIDIEEDKEEDKRSQTVCDDDNPSDIKFDGDSVEIQLAIFMIDEMLKIKEDSKVPSKDVKRLQGWAQQIDYMIRLDNRTPKNIAELFRWTQEDTFWCSNIRSPKKLREKWDTLELQKNRNKPKSNKNLSKLDEMYQKALAEEGGN